MQKIHAGVMNVVAEVLDERMKQDAHWGEQNHSPLEWLAILGEEVGEACQAALRSHFPNHRGVTLEAYREEMLQVAAVAMAALESLDRQAAQAMKARQGTAVEIVPDKESR